MSADRVCMRWTEDNRLVQEARAPYFWRETGSLGEEVLMEPLEPFVPLRIGTYYCCEKAVGTGRLTCDDCEAIGRAWLGVDFGRDPVATVTHWDGERFVTREVTVAEFYRDDRSGT